MRTDTISTLALLFCASSLAASSGCRRAPKSQADSAATAPVASKPDPPLRPPLPKQYQRRRPASASGMATAGKGAMGKTRRGPPEIRPRAPAPLHLLGPGATPRITLRYRFGESESMVWRVKVKQLTRIRKERTCPADPKAPVRGEKVRTIPVAYGLDMVVTANRAPDGLYRLDTRLKNVSMTLPPELASQQKLLEDVLANMGYSLHMSGRGQVTRFSFGKLTPRSVVLLSERLREPLAHLHPLLPTPPVGVGAHWTHTRHHSLQQPGGTIKATYETDYRIVAVRAGKGRQLVDLDISTKVSLAGKLMGNSFQGAGSGSARASLDTERGLLVRAAGSLLLCSAVKGRTSTNQTTFSQVLKR